MSECNSTSEYWAEQWNIRNIGFHKKDVNPMLEKHIKLLTNDKPNRKILFPLCGKSVDMAWLASQGHTVVGVEFVQTAVEDFFAESNLEFTKNIVDDFNVFSTPDNRIKIYNGDFLKFSDKYEGTFECVWDRGALVAIPYEMRVKYAANIHTLLDQEFFYLLDTFKYDREMYSGPPHNVTLDEIIKHYGSKYSIELIDTDPSYRLGINPVLAVEEIVYFLKPQINANPNYWSDRWVNRNIEFHMDSPHSMLVKHMSLLTQDKPSQKFLFPLCGKTVDLAWVVDQGHKAVGIEFSQKAVEEFFQENKLEFIVSVVDEFKVYSALNGKIKIYNGDFLQFSTKYEGSFDCIWDRGALVAIPYEFRVKYAKKMQTLVECDFRYLLDTFYYDITKHSGPPFIVSLKEITEHYGASFVIKKVDEGPYSVYGVEATEIVYILTPV